MAMTIGELVGYVRADSSDFTRGLAQAELRAQGFTVDTGGRLRNLAGAFVSESAVMGQALRAVEEGLEDVSTQTTETTAVVEVETRTMAMRFRALARAADDLGMSLGARLGRAVSSLRNININSERLGSMAGRIGGVALSFGKVAAALGTAVPLAAGLAGVVAQIAPAAGVAATGMVAVVLASQALKLGMKGVGDAVKAAMDPSNPAAFEEAVKNLAPNARAFAREFRTLQPDLKALQQGVQQRMFEGLDGILREMGKTTLPILRNGLLNTGGALNLMARNIGNTAIGLSKSGALGQAISGANTGLYNMAAIPSQIMAGLTQIAAAGAPAFGRLTAAAASGADSLSEKLAKGFQSGGIERAIDQAITLIGQLGSVFGNVGSIIGSVFGAAQMSGGGFVGTLQQITGAIAKAFASPAVQAGLQAIFQTMATLASTIGPLLTTALQALAPVFTALGPPIQRLIGVLGAALGPIITALGPVLEAAAMAVGLLLDAVSPLLPVISDLIVGLLPLLTPLLMVVGDMFKQLAPFVRQVAQVLSSALAPILAVLPTVLGPIVQALGTLSMATLPILSTLLTALAPVIAQLAGVFAELLVALAPVITQLALLIADALTKMMPVIIPIIEVIGKLAAMLGGELGRAIREIVVPALQAITLLLKGDFSGAWDAAKTMVKGVVDYFIRMFTELPGMAATALAGLAGALWTRVQEAGARMNESARQKRDELIGWIRGIPGMARDALGDLGSILWNAGARLIGGLIDGIKSKIGSVKSTLSGLTSMLPDWKGPAEVDGRILRPAGRLLLQGFQRGITDETPALQQQLGALTGALPGMAFGASAGMAGGVGPGRLVIEVTGPDEVKSFIRNIVQVDGFGNVQTAFGTY